MIDGLEENIKKEKKKNKESKLSICKYFKRLHPAKERSERQQQ